LIAASLHAPDQALDIAPRPLPVGALVAFVAVAAVHWWLADAASSPIFSWTSLLLFGWLLLIVARLSAAALILLLPLVITRGAALLSLLVIEAGAYMPEVNQLGTPGDASASFVAVTALFFLTVAILIRFAERPAIAYARSPLIDQAVALLGWPVVIVCVGWGALAFVDGVRAGFPLLQGVDRFLFRREFGSPIILALLDQKFLISVMLGSVAFAPRHAPMLKTAAILTLSGLTCLYFLFGDKFFTILTEVSIFAMPFLLLRRGRLAPTFLRLAPAALALICGSLGATLYIYSDYGKLPMDRTIALVGERVAGQGELWFVATRDMRRVADWDRQLTARYTAVLEEDSGPASASANGVETYYFINRYAPTKLAESFRKSGGWVQFTMGTEAMLLAMFGYVGAMIGMVLAGLIVGLSLLYLRRAFASGFPLSLYFAMWTFLQVYLAVQQASWWSIAAPGQIKRFLLFGTIELVLLAINRGQILSIAGREQGSAFARRLHRAR
jgi:hypothetical protein